MSPYIFCSPQGKFLHNFERYWRPALEVAKIPDFRTDGTSGKVADAETPEKIGAPGGNRTPDPRLRRPMLYPTELRARAWIIAI